MDGTGGPVDDPVPTVEYPDDWRTCEDELLDPLLVTDPDEIENTTYDRLADSRADPP